MQIDSKMLGKTSAPYRIDISPRMAMNFAAGIPDTNPLYFDDESPDGLIAPPIIPVALSWHMTANYNAFWDDGLNADLRPRIVHYSETLQIHQPIEVGESVLVVGEVAAIQPNRAGTHYVVRYTGTAGSGALLFTEYAGAILRGVPVPTRGNTSRCTMVERVRTGKTFQESMRP